MSGDGDDEQELVVMEVIPAPTQPRRRPRTPNPAVDEVIHSGEIDTAARSMIIRSSQSQPAMRVVEEPPRAVVEPPKAAPRRRIQIAWLIAALAPIGAVVALGLVKPAKPPPLQIDEAAAVAQLVGTTIDGEVRSAQVRAEAMASSSMLRAAIQTDAATLADMAKDNDVAFPHKPTETIEVFHVAGERRTSLLRLPADAPATTPPPPGTQRIEQRGDGVIVIADAPVTSGTVTGEVVLVAPIDLSSIRARKYEHLTGVVLTGFPKEIPLGGGPGIVDGATVISPVATTAVKNPAIAVAAVVAVPKEDTSTVSVVRGLRIACAGLAGLFVLMFGISVIRRR